MTRKNEIPVRPENMQQLQEAVDKVQKGCKVRRISAEIIAEALKEVDRELQIPDSAKKGIVVNVDWHAQTFAKAYGKMGIPESTQFKARFASDGWRVTEISRGTCRGASRECLVTLTDKAQEALIRRFSTLTVCG